MIKFVYKICEFIVDIFGICDNVIRLNELNVLMINKQCKFFSVFFFICLKNFMRILCIFCAGDHGLEISEKIREKQILTHWCTIPTIRK